MQKTVIKKLVLFCAVFILLLVLGVILFTIFFDQAVIVRKNTIYHIPASEKVVALTFDDGPSLKWTPEILDVLKAAQVKATFFMLGEHVEQYPDVARRVANEGQR